MSINYVILSQLILQYMSNGTSLMCNVYAYINRVGYVGIIMNLKIDFVEYCLRKLSSKVELAAHSEVAASFGVQIADMIIDHMSHLMDLSSCWDSVGNVYIVGRNNTVTPKHVELDKEGHFPGGVREKQEITFKTVVVNRFPK